MKSNYFLLAPLSLLVFLTPTQVNLSFAQSPYKLGVQENVSGSSSANSYPAPQMIPIPQTNTTHKSPKPLQGNAQQNAHPRAREPLSSGLTAVALPPAFLGSWQVHGQRTKVEAMPEFQAGAEQAFSITNDQIWNISGSQASGYTLGSNTGISTALIVDKVQGNTAFVRYQHPVGNTMAQEAIVMSLLPGGNQFNGLERISIVKAGLPQPRAKVTYQLTGLRQQ